MSDSIFNFGFSRPRNRVEPQISDERGDASDQSHAPDRGDHGADSFNELARMIGQSDPLPPQAGRPGEGPPPGGRLADISRTASATGAAAQREDGSGEDRFRHRSFEGRSFEGRAGLDNRRDPDFARSRLPVHDTDHSEPPAENFDFLQLPDRDDYAMAPRHPAAGEEDHHDRDHREGSLTGQRQYGRQPHDYGDEYHEYGYDEQDEETEYAEHEELDHEAGANRRSSTRVVVAVLGLAIFGTAAAFGYRTIFKADPSGSSPAPIIRADNSPTKITPVSADVNAKPATSVFDGRSKEQLIPRDEEPVDVAAPFGSAAAGTAESSAPVSAPPRGNPGLSGDPKRVRTVPIRADQSEASSSDRPASRSVPPPQSQPRSAQARQAAPQPPAPSPPRQVAAATPASTSPAGDAKATPTVPEPAATRGIEAGGFVVQLSAARSEADAQASFRTLQGKYPALSGREPLIRRKDLGDRGIFFATQVGPFGVKGEADQLCETLKTSGASCFVQKN
jgi:hypothetical protein